MPEPRSSPPALSFRIVKALVRPELLEDIEGTLYQQYREMLAAHTRWPRVRYWYEVLCYLRPSTLKNVKLKNQGLMFHFDPKVAIRHLVKHRASTTISLLGFIVGLVSVTFLYFYVRSELQYDAFHEKGDEVYRVLRINSGKGDPQNIGVSSGPLGEALLNDFPNAIAAINRVNTYQGLVEIDDRQYPDQPALMADANFFEFFSFPLLAGDPTTVLESDAAVVISEELAQKFFGEEDPIGKTLMCDKNGPFEVTGILAEPPAGSHLEFDMVFNMRIFHQAGWFSSWWRQNLNTYVQIPTPEMAAEISSQFPAFMDKYLGEDFDRLGFRNDITLERLPDIYFNNTTDYDFHARHGNLQNVYILIFVALAILFIASFNYVNLAIAQAYQRAKEVGVRKVLGVERRRLVLQFLGESLLITLTAVATALVICVLVKPGFQKWFDIQFTLDWTDPMVLYFVIGTVAIITLTSGLYPALLLSGFHPLQVLKVGKLPLGSSLLVRKGLVIAQFSLSIFLVIITLLVGSQIRYVKTKDLGYNKDAILLVDINSRAMRQNLDLFEERLLQLSSVVKVTAISGEPGGFHDNATLQYGDNEEGIKVYTAFGDPNYLETFDISVVAGRGFDPERAQEDSTVMMLNQSALAATGLSADEIIGEQVYIPTWDLERTVIGIVEDYHFVSLHKSIEPLVIVMDNQARQLAIKLAGDKLSQAVTNIREICTEISPEFPLEYTFHDEDLAAMYMQEDQQVRVFTAFSGISILLACMGIFGLAAFAARRRQKELGIRKVLGASIQHIIALISREFMVLISVATVVAIPAAWYFISQWLADFAYRIELLSHWPIFLGGGLLAGFIALLTVSLRTYRAAIIKPTENIQSE